MGKCNQIRQIVRIRQMLRRWRKTATSSSHTRFTPSDVPAGHVAISVGSGHTRFIMRATYLNHPVFKTLLAQAEEEYGFVNQGPLSIPCEESVFLELLRVVTRTESTNSVRLGVRKSRDIWCESRPLLLG
ncbi:protein SMALL AUXIN UP-REGULATED RNA 12-like [Apium graveolens]|uniref:protein SMALL AUXIN UP-REGULATED RNA 12-like n=1 Tax=Apium graveolens TaxID=4045 RepID=UPI003D7B912D